jgi:hypothetical protein
VRRNLSLQLFPNVSSFFCLFRRPKLPQDRCRCPSSASRPHPSDLVSADACCPSDDQPEHQGSQPAPAPQPPAARNPEPAISASAAPPAAKPCSPPCPLCPGPARQPLVHRAPHEPRRQPLDIRVFVGCDCLIHEKRDGRPLMRQQPSKREPIYHGQEADRPTIAHIAKVANSLLKATTLPPISRWLHLRPGRRRTYT